MLCVVRVRQALNIISTVNQKRFNARTLPQANIRMLAIEMQIGAANVIQLTRCVHAFH